MKPKDNAVKAKKFNTQCRFIFTLYSGGTKDIIANSYKEAISNLGIRYTDIRQTKIKTEVM